MDVSIFAQTAHDFQFFLSYKKISESQRYGYIKINSTLFKEFLRECAIMIKTHHTFFYYMKITTHKNLFNEQIAHNERELALFPIANVCVVNKYVDIIFHSPTRGTDNRI